MVIKKLASFALRDNYAWLGFLSFHYFRRLYKQHLYALPRRSYLGHRLASVTVLSESWRLILMMFNNDDSPDLTVRNKNYLSCRTT